MEFEGVLRGTHTANDTFKQSAPHQCIQHN